MSLGKLILNSDPLLSNAETAKFLHTSTVFLWKERKDGRIQSVVIGRKVFFRKSAIDAYVKERTKEAAHG